VLENLAAFGDGIDAADPLPMWIGSKTQAREGPESIGVCFELGAADLSNIVEEDLELAPGGQARVQELKRAGSGVSGVGKRLLASLAALLVQG